MKYFLNIEEIRPLAKGHWDYIFSALAPQLSAAMEQPGSMFRVLSTEGKTALGSSLIIKKMVHVSATPAANLGTGLKHSNG